MANLLRPPVGGAAPVVEHNSEHVSNELQILEGRRQELMDRFEALGMVGQSLALLRVFDAVERVSACTQPPIPVLITGETGVGKELVARAIYARDPQRNRGPFVPVNCSAVNSMLVESALFGHRQGAFTGAVNNQKGMFRAANGGTIFLDAIEALPSEMQPKLLRVLEERCVWPLGQWNPVPIDVRIIAATNVPMSGLIARGFRKDLYYRLKGYEIVIPPLRKRREDIVPQAQYFLKRHDNVAQGRVTTIAPEALDLLTTHLWEGNSRELDYVIWNALIRKRSGSLLEAHDLHQPSVDAVDESTPLLFVNAAEAERQLIASTLEACSYQRAQTARRLGISRVTLYRKMLKYDLMDVEKP